MRTLHPWTLAPEAARQLQAELRQQLVLAWDGRPVAAVAGVDVSVREERARAAIVVLGFPSLEPLEAVTAEAPVTFPYVPGLLSFREAPVILQAWQQLTLQPDLVLFDGQGIAHPRGLGIASHMGLWLERPTVGVAKSRLYGRHEAPGPERGDLAELLSPETPPRRLGVVMRTRPGTNPLYISPGHLMDVPQAAAFARACLAGYRLPEPTRWAHRIAGGGSLPGASPTQAALF
jgi:deoxyribonuclease V